MAVYFQNGNLANRSGHGCAGISSVRAPAGICLETEQFCSPSPVKAKSDSGRGSRELQTSLTWAGGALKIMLALATDKTGANSHRVWTKNGRQPKIHGMKL